MTHMLFGSEDGSNGLLYMQSLTVGRKRRLQRPRTLTHGRNRPCAQALTVRPLTDGNSQFDLTIVAPERGDLSLHAVQCVHGYLSSFTVLRPREEEDIYRRSFSYVY